MNKLDGNFSKTVLESVSSIKDKRLTEIKKYFKRCYGDIGKFIGLEMIHCGLNENYSNIEDVKYEALNRCYELFNLYKEEDALKCLRVGEVSQERMIKVKYNQSLIRDFNDFKSKIIEFEYHTSCGLSKVYYKCPCCGTLYMSHATAATHYGECLNGELDNRLTILIRVDRRFKCQMRNEEYTLHKIDDEYEINEHIDGPLNIHDEYVVKENSVHKNSNGFEVYVEEQEQEDVNNVKRRRLM